MDNKEKKPRATKKAKVNQINQVDQVSQETINEILEAINIEPDPVDELINSINESQIKIKNYLADKRFKLEILETCQYNFDFSLDTNSNIRNAFVRTVNNELNEPSKSAIIPFIFDHLIRELKGIDKCFRSYPSNFTDPIMRSHYDNILQPKQLTVNYRILMEVKENKINGKAVYIPLIENGKLSNDIPDLVNSNEMMGMMENNIDFIEKTIVESLEKLRLEVNK